MEECHPRGEEILLTITVIDLDKTHHVGASYQPREEDREEVMHSLEDSPTCHFLTATRKRCLYRWRKTTDTSSWKWLHGTPLLLGEADITCPLVRCPEKVTA